VGTVIAIWGQLRELADYQRLLEGGYTATNDARWHVDPSLLTMVRAYLRNYKAALGPLMKRQTDTALVAIRVETTGRMQTATDWKKWNAWTWWCLSMVE
jgi:hypothetical protein